MSARNVCQGIGTFASGLLGFYAGDAACQFFRITPAELGYVVKGVATATGAVGGMLLTGYAVDGFVDFFKIKPSRSGCMTDYEKIDPREMGFTAPIDSMVVGKLVTLYRYHFGNKANDLFYDTPMKDLEVDSLDQVELIMDAEDEFHIEISDEEAKKYMTTFGKFAGFIDERKKRASP